MIGFPNIGISGGSSDPTAIFKIIYSTVNDRADSLAQKINLLPKFDGDKSLWITSIVRNVGADFLNINRIEKYKVANKGAGSYGVGGTITVTAQDLELVYKENADVNSLITNPLVQKITIANLNGLSIATYVNTASPSITVQSQAIAPILFFTPTTSYLFLGAGGTYGLGFLQTTDADFQEIEEATTIEIDSTVIQNSPNAVSGGGVFDYITITPKTKTEINLLITNNQLIVGKFYKIANIDNWCDGVFQAISTNELNLNGVGIFKNPNYDSYELWTNQFYYGVTVDSGTPILDDVFTNGIESFVYKTDGLYIKNQNTLPNGVYTSYASQITINNSQSVQYSINEVVIFGNKHWKNVNGNLGAKVDELNLDSEWEEVATDLITVIDEIQYDIDNDWISNRKDNKGNDITLTKFQSDDNSGNNFNYLKTFNWGKSSSYNNKISKWFGEVCNLNFSLINNIGTNFTLISNTGYNFSLINNRGDNFSLNNNTGYNFSLNSNRGDDFEISYNTGNYFNVNRNKVNNFEVSYNTGNNFNVNTNTGNYFYLSDNVGNNITLNNNKGNNFSLNNNQGNSVSLSNNQGNGFTLESNTGNNFQLYNNTGNDFNVRNNTGNNFQLYTNTGNDFKVRNNTGNDFYLYNNSVNTFQLNNNTGDNFNLSNNTGNVFQLANKDLSYKVIQFCDFKDILIDTSIDISASTYLFASYGKSIFKDINDTITISYGGGSGIITAGISD